MNHKKGLVHRNREKALLDSRQGSSDNNSNNNSPAPSQFRPSPSPARSVSSSTSNVKNHTTGSSNNNDSSSAQAPVAAAPAADVKPAAKPSPPTPEEIEAGIEKLKEQYVEVDDPKTGKKKQKLIVPDTWEFCKPCGAHLRTQQVKITLGCGVPAYHFPPPSLFRLEQINEFVSIYVGCFCDD